MRLHFTFSKEFRTLLSPKIKCAILVPSNYGSAPIKIAYWLALLLPKYGVCVKLFWVDNIKNGLFDADDNYAFFNIYDFDIVHSHLLRPDIFIFFNILKYKFSNIFKQKKIKFITTLHSDIFTDLRSDHNVFFSYIVTFFWLLILNFFDKVVVLTEYAKNKYRNFLKNKLAVIHNGIPLEYYLPNTSYFNYESSSKLNIGYIGALRKIKGVDLLLMGLKDFKENYSINIAGSGGEKKFLEDLISLYGMNDKVKFFDHVDNISEFIESNDLFIFPSRSEGFSLAILEVLYYSKPIIVSNIGTFQELFISDGIKYFDLNNPKSLHNVINNLDWTRNDNFGRSIINQKYNTNIMSKNYFNLYTNILINT